MRLFRTIVIGFRRHLLLELEFLHVSAQAMTASTEWYTVVSATTTFTLTSARILEIIKLFSFQELYVLYAIS